jgi:hypothetical protein
MNPARFASLALRLDFTRYAGIFALTAKPLADFHLRFLAEFLLRTRHTCANSDGAGLQKAAA